MNKHFLLASAAVLALATASPVFADNESTIDQIGDGHSATTTQAGGANFADVLQNNGASTSVIMQNSVGTTNNEAWVQQTGAGLNDSNISQGDTGLATTSEGSYANVEQTGDGDHESDITQTGLGQEARVLQTGLTGAVNNSTITQSDGVGTGGNIASVAQGSVAAIDPITGVITSGNVETVSANTSNVTQSGSGNFVAVNQY